MPRLSARRQAAAIGKTEKSKTTGGDIHGSPVITSASTHHKHQLSAHRATTLLERGVRVTVTSDNVTL
jgi:hypothetical protein